MIHHFKETVLTIVPSLGGLYTALEVTDAGLKVLVGGLTAAYLVVRIFIAIKDYIKRKNTP